MIQNPRIKKDHLLTQENFASTTLSIIDLFKNSEIGINDFRIADPSKIRADDSLFVSVYLSKISENPLVKNHTISAFSEPENQYFFSEKILYYLLTVHSNDHILEINAIEEMLGVIYNNLSIPVSNEVQEAHLRVNLNDDPIEVWNKLFPSIPYTPSILLEVHGPGVTYLRPTTPSNRNIYSYDSTKEPDELYNL